jgi:hypothetical protein
MAKAIKGRFSSSIYHIHPTIHLWRKVVCFVVLRCPPKEDASDRVLGVVGKLSTRRGAWLGVVGKLSTRRGAWLGVIGKLSTRRGAWPGVIGKLSTRRGAWAWFQDIWTCGAKVFENWMISSLKIKLNRSWKFLRNWNVPLVLLERSWWAGFNGIYLPIKWIQMCWERGNTWRLAIQFKHDFLSYLALQKINAYIAKQCSHVQAIFVLGSHLGQRHTPH